MNAVNFEAQLRKVVRGSAGHREAEVGLVRCVAHLNSVANFKRKGRDDLGVDILESAREVLQRCESGRASDFRPRAARARARRGGVLGGRM